MRVGRSGLWRWVPVLVMLALALFTGCADEGKEAKSTSRGAGFDSPLVQSFRTNHPSLEILLTARADLDADGREDLVVIYRVDGEKNMMRVLLDAGGVAVETNEVPAPHSHQNIRIFDMDRKPPLEFVVQGMKGAKVGFAVFRVEQGVLVDLFGEGMEDCC